MDHHLLKPFAAIASPQRATRFHSDTSNDEIPGSASRFALASGGDRIARITTVLLTLWLGTAGALLLPLVAQAASPGEDEPNEIA